MLHIVCQLSDRHTVEDAGVTGGLLTVITEMCIEPRCESIPRQLPLRMSACQDRAGERKARPRPRRPPHHGEKFKKPLLLTGGILCLAKISRALAMKGQPAQTLTIFFLEDV